MGGARRLKAGMEGSGRLLAETEIAQWLQAVTDEVGRLHAVTERKRLIQVGTKEVRLRPKTEMEGARIDEWASTASDLFHASFRLQSMTQLQVWSDAAPESREAFYIPVWSSAVRPEMEGSRWLQATMYETRQFQGETEGAQWLQTGM